MKVPPKAVDVARGPTRQKYLAGTLQHGYLCPTDLKRVNHGDSQAALLTNVRRPDLLLTFGLALRV